MNGNGKGKTQKKKSWFIEENILHSSGHLNEVSLLCLCARVMGVACQWDLLDYDANFFPTHFFIVGTLKHS